MKEQEENDFMNSEKTKIGWEGSLFVHHSLGMVNRELLIHLLDDNTISLSTIPYEPDQFIPSNKYKPLLSKRTNKDQKYDIYIRHKWPPDFTRLPHTYHILFQPWEFGYLPVDWVGPLFSHIDEVWVYSKFVRDTFVKRGTHIKNVHVIPLGVNPDLFHPNGVPLKEVSLLINNKFCFFFNGGVNTRKGADILINAYLNEFRKDENVCLLIKDSTFYKSQMSQQIKALSFRNDIAQIIYTNENLMPEQLASIYCACNCYVHPYRAEGFGLPIAEAMACGLPVIVSNGGSCKDFTNHDLVYYINCETEFFSEKKVNSLETINYPFWLKPDQQHLQYLMRFVFENQSKGKELGKKASKYIIKNHTWKHGAEYIKNRINILKNNLVMRCY